MNIFNYTCGEHDIEKMIKIIDKQQKEIEELKEKQDYARLEKEQLLEDSISKDKIREKIKKYEKLDKEEFAKQGNFETEISLLKELLEEK